MARVGQGQGQASRSYCQIPICRWRRQNIWSHSKIFLPDYGYRASNQVHLY